MLQQLFFLPKWPEKESKEELIVWKKDITNLKLLTNAEFEKHFSETKLDGLRKFIERCGQNLDEMQMCENTKILLEKETIEAVFSRIKLLCEYFKSNKDYIRQDIMFENILNDRKVEWKFFRNKFEAKSLEQVNREQRKKEQNRAEGK